MIDTTLGARRRLVLFGSTYPALLKELSTASARVLVIGSNALRFRRPTMQRAPADLDLLIQPEFGNAELVLAAVRKYVAPSFDQPVAAFTRPNVVCKVTGYDLVDLFTPVEPDGFAAAWDAGEDADVEGLPVRVAGEETLRTSLTLAIDRNQTALEKASSDLAFLEGAEPSSVGELQRLAERVAAMLSTVRPGQHQADLREIHTHLVRLASAP